MNKKDRLNLYKALLEEPKSIIRSIFYYIKYRKNLRRNKTLKGAFKSSRLFILGDGPSINDYDIELLKDENIMVMNSFYKNNSAKVLFSGKGSKFYLIPPLHGPSDREELLYFTRKVEECIKRDTFLLLGINDYIDSFLKIGCFDNAKYDSKYYFLPCGPRYLEYCLTSSSFFDLEYPVLSAGTASVYAILLAGFMGFREIYLLGVDHSEILYKLKLSKDHFWDVNNSKKIHNYVENDLLLYLISSTLYQYKLIANYYRNSKIFNCSKISLVDNFKYKNIDSIFQ